MAASLHSFYIFFVQKFPTNHIAGRPGKRLLLTVFQFTEIYAEEKFKELREFIFIAGLIVHVCVGCLFWGWIFCGGGWGVVVLCFFCVCVLQT